MIRLKLEIILGLADKILSCTGEFGMSIANARGQSNAWKSVIYFSFMNIYFNGIRVLKGNVFFSKQFS